MTLLNYECSGCAYDSFFDILYNNILISATIKLCRSMRSHIKPSRYAWM